MICRLWVWIDNKLIVEQWVSLGSQTPSGTFRFAQKEFLYDIVVEYRHKDSEQQAALRWMSDGSYAAATCDFSSPSPSPPSTKSLLPAILDGMELLDSLP